jgi:hypothetical protein
MAADSVNHSDNVSTKNESAVYSPLGDEAVRLAYGRPGTTDKTDKTKPIQEPQKEVERAAEFRLAEQMTKNPVIFAAIIKSSFATIDKNHDRGLSHAEVNAYAGRTDIDPVSKSAAAVLNRHFDLLASAYGSSKYFASGDLDEFRASLRLDSRSMTGEALDEATKWGTGMYAASEAIDSHQSETNAAVSVVGSLLGSAMLAVKRERFYGNIKNLNYFDIPK